MLESREHVFISWKYQLGKDTLRVLHLINEDYRRIVIIKACLWDIQNNVVIRQLKSHEIQIATDFILSIYEDYFVSVEIED